MRRLSSFKENILKNFHSNCHFYKSTALPWKNWASKPKFGESFYFPVNLPIKSGLIASFNLDWSWLIVIFFLETNPQHNNQLSPDYAIALKSPQWDTESHQNSLPHMTDDVTRVFLTFAQAHVNVVCETATRSVWRPRLNYWRDRWTGLPRHNHLESVRVKSIQIE